MEKRKSWKRRFRIIGCFGTMVLLLGCTIMKEWKPLATKDTELKKILETAIADSGQPSVACSLVRSENPTIFSAAGLTRIGDGIPVTDRSLYHIGSTTKSMTAVLAAILIEKERLDFSTTLSEALPGMEMRDEYRDKTILDLMLSRAGIIPFQQTTNEDPAVVQALWTDIPAANKGDPWSERAAITAYVLSLPPIHSPGEEAVPVYSNVSWAILGHILEVTAGMSYEEALITMVFKPLGIEGFKLGGWPRDDYGIDEPVGHYPPEDPAHSAIPRPQSAADDYSFPAWMNPAGGVNMDIQGFSQYAIEQLRGLNGKGILLSKASYEKIHSVNAVADYGHHVSGGKFRPEAVIGPWLGDRTNRLGEFKFLRTVQAGLSTHAL